MKLGATILLASLTKEGLISSKAANVEVDTTSWELRGNKLWQHVKKKDTWEVCMSQLYYHFTCYIILYITWTSSIFIAYMAIYASWYYFPQLFSSITNCLNGSDEYIKLLPNQKEDGLFWLHIRFHLESFSCSSCHGIDRLVFFLFFSISFSKRKASAWICHVLYPTSKKMPGTQFF